MGRWSASALPVALLGLWITGAQQALADSYVVDTIVDNPSLTECSAITSGDCSLRGAIIKANTTPGGAPHTITVPSGIYTLAIGPGHTNEDLAQIGDLDLNVSMSITGAGAASTIVEAALAPETPNRDRVFHIRGGTATISGLTIRHGNLPGTAIDTGGGVRVETGATAKLSDVHITRNFGHHGGGIFSSGTLELQRSTLSANRAWRGGGAFTTGPIDTLINVTVSGNIAGGGEPTTPPTASGILVFGSLLIASSTVVQNTGAEGIFVTSGASATVANSIVALNTGAGGAPSNCSGSIISAGHNLSNTTECPWAGAGDQEGIDPLQGIAPLQLNRGQTPTHGLLLGSTAIDRGNPSAPGSGGAACPAIDQRGVARPVDGDSVPGARCDIGAYERAPVAVSVDRADDPGAVEGCTSAPNDCPLRGAIRFLNADVAGGSIAIPAGLYRLGVPGAEEDHASTGDLDIKVDTNISGAGAAQTIVEAGASFGTGIDRVFDVLSGTLTMSGVTVRHGTVGASQNGGGVQLRSGTAATFTEIALVGNRADGGGGIRSSGTLTLTRVTVSGNEALTTGGGIVSSGSSTLTNVTVSGNTAGNVGASGIYHGGSGLGMLLNNVTIAGNTTAANQLNIGAGLVSDGTSFAGNATLVNSIVAGNRVGTTLSNCQAGFNFASRVQSGGYNVSDGTDCPFETAVSGDQEGVDPRLGPLGNHGGPTQTMALLNGSPAVDTGNPGPSGTLCAGTDQRGVTRPGDGNVDGVARCDKGAYEAPPCTNNRPNVALGVGASGSNTISVTVTAGNGTISRIRGISAKSSNVLVDINGLTNQPSSFNVVPNGNPASISMSLHRANGTGSGTLAFIVTDGCGEWETFAGGGPNAWPAGGAAPAPAQGPTPTPSPRSTPVASSDVGAACATFANHAEAQAYLRKDPTDPLLLDKNRNGIACEGADGAGFVNAPLDHVPVPRP